MLEEILRKLNITGTPARIYIKLLKLGPSSARRLAELLGLPRPSVYDGLKVLEKEMLVVERQEDNKKIFSVNDPKILAQRMEEKISELQKDMKDFKEILPKLSKEVETVEPKIQFFSGKEGVWKMIHDMLWYKGTTTSAMWSISEMIELFGEKEFEQYHRRREKNEIWINVIWPKDKIINFKKYPWLASDKKYLREIRIAPKGTTWNMSYWMYEDKILFVSSQKELFGFIVQSKDFTDLMRVQFQIMWNISKPLK